MINISIIGTGLIGEKRAQAILKNSKFNLLSAYNPDTDSLDKFVMKFHCKKANNFVEILQDKQVDLVILAIPHKSAAELAPEILKYHHLLIEKPLGRNIKETENIIKAAKKNHRRLFVGFNYRYYPHVQLANKYLKNNIIGKIISSTFKIGHAAFPGYEKTWKMDKDLCGGGVILDPGIHMIDLLVHFFGQPKKYQTLSNRLGWRRSIEDEAFISFYFADKSISFHHYSLNLSKNTFFIELVGTKGIIRLVGRGGNHGNMIFSFIPKWFWLGKKESQVKELNFGNSDNSFTEELNDIYRNIVNNKTINYTNYQKTMQLYELIKNG